MRVSPAIADRRKQDLHERGPARTSPARPPARSDLWRAALEAAVATLALVIVGAVGMAGLYEGSAQAIRSELRDDLRRLASAAASLVDGDLHTQINDPAMMDGELYNRIIEPLRRVRAGTPGVKYVYTAVRDGERVRFVLDSAVPGDHDGDGREDRSHVWEEYTDAEPAIWLALGTGGRRGVATSSPEPYSDEWGTFVTGYAPFYSTAGEQVGIVGVDISAEVHLGRIAEARRTAMLGVIPAIVVAGFMGAGVYVLRRRALTDARTVLESRAALAASEARAVTLIEGSDIILWEYSPARGVFEYVSPQAEKLGYPLAEWFTPGFWEAHLHPEDREAAVSFCREQTMQGLNHRLQYRMMKPDGTCVWMDDVVAVSREADGSPILRGVFIDITERKNAEDRLREVYTRLQKIASQVPGMVYQFKRRPDGSSCFPYASDGIREIFRLEPAEVRSDASRAFAVLHPDDLAEMHRSIEVSAAALTPWRSEFRVRFADGAVRCLMGNSLPQREPDGSTLWHGFICDNTERKADEEQLLAVKRRFELARRSVRMGVWEWSVSEQRLIWDDGMADLFDLDERGTSGPFDKWQARAHPEDISRVSGEFHAALMGPDDAFDTSFRVVHRDGTVLWLASHGVVERNAAGAPLRMVGINLDITRQVQARDALARARDAAEAANRAKSLFLANMSHEIRTPLTAILGYADLLRDDGDSSKAPPHRIELIDTIRTAGRHLLEIINDILDLSKIEAGKMTFESVETDLTSLLHDVDDLLRPRATAKGIGFSVQLDTPVPDRVMTDPTRLRQILTNLAGNAVKFTEKGEVAIRISVGRSRLRFDIEDSGMGMSPEQSAAIFQPFAQADASVTRRHGGTGLGLAICRRLAHMMGGEVTLRRTAPGAGSVFRLDLPLKRAPGALDAAKLGADRRAANDLHAHPDALRSVRILLAEDAVENQRLIIFYLNRAGAQVEAVDNGEAALVRLGAARDSGVPFQLLITDVQMPVMDGRTLTRKLRAAGFTLPVIALTAHAMNEDRDKCIEAGCNGYATKPIDPKGLVRLCAQMVAQMADRMVPTNEKAEAARQPRL